MNTILVAYSIIKRKIKFKMLEIFIHYYEKILTQLIKYFSMTFVWSDEFVIDFIKDKETNK